MDDLALQRHANYTIMKRLQGRMVLWRAPPLCPVKDFENVLLTHLMLLLGRPAMGPYGVRANASILQSLVELSPCMPRLSWLPAPHEQPLLDELKEICTCCLENLQKISKCELKTTSLEIRYIEG